MRTLVQAVTCSIVLTVFAVWPALPQPQTHDVPAWQRGDTPAIHGVTLGTTLGAVRDKLGTPQVDRIVPSTEDDTLGMGELRTVVYDGLTLGLCRPRGRPDFHVWQITMTGPRWTLSPGVKIGMKRDRVIKLLGEPGSVSKDSATGTEGVQYTFVSFDGWLWAEFAQGKLVRIGLTEDWT